MVEPVFWERWPYKERQEKLKEKRSGICCFIMATILMRMVSVGMEGTRWVRRTSGCMTAWPRVGGASGLLYSALSLGPSMEPCRLFFTIE